MDRTISRRITLDSSGLRRWLVVCGLGIATALSMAPLQAQNLCGGATYPFPYTDVAAVGAAFCPGIMEAYVTGVSRGTTPTTFSPNQTVSRVQMATFLQRSLDQGLARTGRRAALNRWWTPQDTAAMQTVSVGGNGELCAADGEDIWVATDGQVVQVQANTGKVQGTWTGATSSSGVLAAAGKIFVVGSTLPASLYLIDPTQTPGTVTLAASNLGDSAQAIAFDGINIWVADFGSQVSIITLQASTPYPVTNVSGGFAGPSGILYDGTHIWVTDFTAGTLLKLNASGAVIQTVPVGSGPQGPVFDGANIWVPNANDNSITVVQASSGDVVATIAADVSNLLSTPSAASFDGERVLVTNSGGHSVTVFKAADLSLIANVSTGALTTPLSTCSDGINFWITLLGSGNVLRF
jgi:hypothetical protein